MEKKTGPPRTFCVVIIWQLKYFFFQMLEAPTLLNVSFTVKPEQLLAVIGPVGAGKVCPRVMVINRVSVFKLYGRVPYE